MEIKEIREKIKADSKVSAEIYGADTERRKFISFAGTFTQFNPIIHNNCIYSLRSSFCSIPPKRQLQYIQDKWSSIILYIIWSNTLIYLSINVYMIFKNLVNINWFIILKFTWTRMLEIYTLYHRRICSEIRPNVIWEHVRSIP